jgi:hypothetical protein
VAEVAKGNPAMNRFCIVMMSHALLGCFSLTETKAADAKKSIGYPSVDAARADLQKRNATVRRIRKSYIAMWDSRDLTYWYFSRPSHPTHPAAFKFGYTDTKGKITLNRASLCSGGKQICNHYTAKFEAFTQQSLTISRRWEATKSKKWNPTKKQLYDVVGRAERFFAALESTHLRDAHNLFGPALKTRIPYDSFAGQWRKVMDLAGGKHVRTKK